MKIEDVLAPWEHDANAPPKVALVELFKWRDEDVRLALLNETNGQARLVVRLGHDDGSWMVAGPYSDFCEWMPWSPTLDALRELATQALNKERMCRVFKLPEIVQIAPNGLGAWVNDVRPSQFSFGRRIFQESSSQTYNWLQTLLLRPSSDASFARKFSQSNAQERWLHVFGFDSEEQLKQARVELEWLCVRVLSAYSSAWNQDSRIAWSLLPTNDRHTACFSFTYLNTKSKEQFLHNEFDAWAKVLEEFGPLHPDLAHLCLQDWFNNFGVLNRGQLEAPNFHEQLEARLELRAWAKSHLPVDVQMELERLES